MRTQSAATESISSNAGRTAPLGVVLLGFLSALDRGDRVADEFVDLGSRALDHVASAVEVSVENRPDLLEATGLAEAGEADNVGKHQRDEAALAWFVRRGRDGCRDGSGTSQGLRRSLRRTSVGAVGVTVAAHGRPRPSRTPRRPL